MSQKTTISEIIQLIESIAPLSLQESYDNAGLQTGNASATVESVLITLDVTEEVIDEAIAKGASLIIAHHPVIFGGIKKLTGKNPVERIIIKAIQNNIAIYAAHTNIDSIVGGVNTKIADLIGLGNQRILQPAKDKLKKLVTFVPASHLEEVRQAIFAAGAGTIGNYDQCSFNAEGLGTFRGNDDTNPFVGTKGELHTEPEIRFETIFPEWKQNTIVNALIKAHPYEEVAYDIYSLDNLNPQAGAGVIGTLTEAMDAREFLARIQTIFKTPVIRHTPLTGNKVKTVAVCGGAGSFLLRDAIAAGADFFITGDVKYHQFFDADQRIVLADIGHYESEQFTKELFYELLTKKFSTFAVHLSEVNTNPVNYYFRNS